MKEALEKVAREVPYSTIQRTFVTRGLGYELPPNFGGNCRRLADEVAKLLRPKGYTPQFIRDFGGVHIAPICPEDGEKWLLDASLGQMDPISLTALMRDREEKSYVCNPPMPEGQAQGIVLIPRESNTMTMKFVRYNPKSLHQVTWRTYHFPLDDIYNELPPDRVKDLPPMMKVFADDNALLQLNVDANFRMSASRLGGSRPNVQVRAQKDRATFVEILEEVSGRVKVGTDQILDTFKRAQELLMMKP